MTVAASTPRTAETPSPKLPRIVAFAFDCHPDRGSEHGAGWIWSRLLAGIGETTVLVAGWKYMEETLARARSLPPAEMARLRFEVVEHPKFLHKLLGERPWPPFWYLEYAIWLARARRRAQELHAEQPFDLSWHLTWANAWFGTLAGRVGPPFVYGPVGAGASTPWRLLPIVGARGAVGEIVRTFARNAGRYLNPVARGAVRDASLILAQNPETRQWMPADRRSLTVVFPHVVFEHRPTTVDRNQAATRTALFAGRLLAWKGGELALRTIARLPEHRLIVVGDGPDAGRLRRIADRLGIADRVEFRGWAPRDALGRIMREEATAFLFPSLHDEGGWVVAEAISHGLPVICLDRGGPPILGGRGVPARGPESTVRSLAMALEEVEGTTADPSVIRDLAGATREVRALLVERGLIPLGEQTG